MSEAEETKPEQAKPKTRVEELRAQVAAARAANEPHEQRFAEAAEIESLERELIIEKKRGEAYAAGLVPTQLFEAEWDGIGRCLVRTPTDIVYNKFAKKSGMLKGDLKEDPLVYEELAFACLIVPDGKTFLTAARERCPHAIVQLGGGLLKRMRDRLEEEGK